VTVAKSVANAFINAANAIEKGTLTALSVVGDRSTQAAIASILALQSLPSVLGDQKNNAQIAAGVADLFTCAFTLGLVCPSGSGQNNCPSGQYMTNAGHCCPNGAYYVPKVNGFGGFCSYDNFIRGVGASNEQNCNNYQPGGAQWFDNLCIANSSCPPCPPGQKASPTRQHCECVSVYTQFNATHPFTTNQFGIPLCSGKLGMSLDGFSCVPVTDKNFNQNNPACPVYVTDSTGNYNFCRSSCPPGSIAGTGFTSGECWVPSGQNIATGPPGDQFSYPG
jgi:hypothetical protein